MPAPCRSTRCSRRSCDHLDHLTAIVGRLLDGGEGAPLRPLTMPPQPLPTLRRPTPAWLPIAIAGLVGLVAIAIVAAMRGALMASAGRAAYRRRRWTYM